VAVLECAMASDLSFHINTDKNFRKDAFLFGEAQSRVIVSIDPSQKNTFETTLKSLNVPFFALGEVAQNEIKIDGVSYGNCHEYKHYFDTALSTIMAEN
jgi:phosphoribosylformylglycinamidine synthase